MEAARAAGRIASLKGAEGGHPINNSLATLRALHALGVRSVTVVGAHWTATGLTPFGESVIR